MPAEVCSLELVSLNELMSNRSNVLLANRLQISLEAADAIRSISATVKKDILFAKEKNADTSNHLLDISNHLLLITIRLSYPKFIDTVQNSLVRFLENNPYSVRRKEIKRTSLNLLKANLLKKAQSLDSLKSIVNSSIVPRSSGQGIILGEPVNPVSIYQAEITYYKEQLKVDEELALIENIEVVQPFLKINISNYPNYNDISLYFLFGGAIFAFIYVSIRGKK
ncbi:MAG: hypothetical protein K2X48_05845 [Chitinophagaceae bacterium]|nr:hypothetical protein [Chitinophagaceae bacterium]